MKKQAKEIEIPVKFHNYKLLKDDKFTLTGSFIYFVQGPNEVGKTSFLKALESIQIANDDTPAKVTSGESEGSYEMTIPAANGDVITIRHEFKESDSKGRFIAITEDGTKISSVTKIREMFNYTPVNIHEFFAMSNTAAGRKKQKEIILKLLDESEREKYEQLELQEEHHYTTRTEINNNLKSVESSLKEVNIPEELSELLKREEEARKLIKKYETALIAKRDLRDIDNGINELDNEIADLEKRIEFKKNKLKEKKEQKENMKIFIGDLSDLSEDIIRDKIQKGSEILRKIAQAKASEDLIKDLKTKQQKFQEESESKTEEIEIIRKKKSEIITKSDLPVENISFEDGYLTINGFQFKENQVCESDGVLILANILAKINPGPIQVIGDASILDAGKLKELNDIAEKNNKVMFVDEVVRDATDLAVVGYETMDKKTYDAKPKASKSSQKPSKKKDTEESGQVEKKENKPSGEDSQKPLF